MSRRVGYDGEEIGICHSLTFQQVLPALPPKEHGGSIPVEKFLSEGTQHWLSYPEKLVIDDWGQDLPRLQGRIHIVAEDVDRVAETLVDRGVCQWVDWDEVAEFRGQKILNGMFGVPKSSQLADGRCILRLIMNLIPANSIMKQLTAGTKRLPHITSWLSTFINEEEELRIWQSDMSNAFYLFRIPQPWVRFLCFNIKRDGRQGDVGIPGKTYCLGCQVLPMGWSSSVGRMQAVSREVLLTRGMPMCDEIKKGF